mgnify:CR=1 FL=1
MITVAIVDDHPLVIQGLRTVLDASGKIQVIGAAQSGGELMQWLLTSQPEVLLLDIDLPDNDGIELCKMVLKDYPGIRILALTAYSQVSFIESMVKNGAKGYLFKNTSESELIAAIEALHAGKEYFSEAVYKKMLFKDKFQRGAPFVPKLTRREKEILELIFQEKTNQEIASELFISVSTVETHRTNLCSKLNARNTAGLVKNALKFGLLP